MDRSRRAALESRLTSEDATTLPTIRLETVMRAPIARCFDLARSIDLHIVSTAQTGERAVGGVTTGLIGPGEHVTWRAKHFGVWQELTRPNSSDIKIPFSVLRTMLRSIHHGKRNPVRWLLSLFQTLASGPRTS